MTEEHLLQPDSKEVFSTNNYGVQYTLFTAVCNKFAHQTQILSSLFDLLKLNPMLVTSISSILCACLPCGCSFEGFSMLYFLLINFIEDIEIDDMLVDHVKKTRAS